MTETKIRRLKFVYGICLSALTVVVGALFIMQVWSIFFSAEQSPYTRAIVAEKFMQILAPVCLWVVGIVGGVVIERLFPDGKAKLKGDTDLRKTLERLKGRLPQNEGGMVEVNKQSLARKIVFWVSVALCLGVAATVLFHLLNEAYTPWFEGEFFLGHNAAADRLVRILPWLAGGMLVCVGAALFNDYSVEKEISIVKATIAENAKKGIKPVQSTAKKLTLWETLCEKFPALRSKWWKLGFQTGLCVLGVTLFIVGIVNGGMADVYEKAKNICTQCIGLG